MIALRTGDRAARGACDGDVDHRLSEGLRGFLWKIVADAAFAMGMRLFLTKKSG